MEYSENIKQYPVSNQYTQVNLVSLFRKMISYKTLILASAFIGIVISLIWGLILYKPSYDMSVSYSYKISTNSTFSSMYGVQYFSPDDFVAMVNHPDTAKEYLNESDNGGLKITDEQFLKPIDTKYEQGIISIKVKEIKDKKVILYKNYLEYCIDSFNRKNRDKVATQLNSAKSRIADELKVVESKFFEAETVNSSNYSYSITLNDRIKSIDTQLTEIEEGAIRTFSDYEITKVSSRVKDMVIIVLLAFFIGFFTDFIICFFDNHIYFSDDITDIPNLGKKLLSCIPLYRGNKISDKEFVNIVSKLPNEVSSISVSEISEHAGAKDIAYGLQHVSPSIKVEYVGCLLSDADIFSFFSKYNINLIILRNGINTVNQVKNIIHDCRLKGVESFYFVLYGLELSDKMVTQFENETQYIKYSILSYRTFEQHYRKYYDI